VELKRRLQKGAKLLEVCLLALLAMALSTMNVYANTDMPLSQAEIKQVTQSISKLMLSEYIHPEQAKQIAQLLTKKTKSGEYNKFKQPQAFSEQLTKDLRSINHDFHLNVIFDPERIAEQKSAGESPQEQQISQRELREWQRANYGFSEIKLLEGNIGYINLTGFYDPTYAGETAVAAMNFLANADAIIFDLRENRGGAGEMYQLLASYLFDSGAVQLNDIYWPLTNSHYQTWTLPHVPGKRRPDVDVYILTSKSTASAAEVFSYSLKHLKRATLIGETSVGAANPGGFAIVSDRFMIWLSKGEAINPITKTNFEGKGVIPHIATAKEDAFHVAYTTALEKLIVKHPDDAFFYQWNIDIINAQNKVIEIPSKTMQTYSGLYGEERELSFFNGELFYQLKGRKKQKLKAISQDLFMLPGVNYYRVKIIKENNNVVAIMGLYDDGRSFKYIKKT